MQMETNLPLMIEKTSEAETAPPYVSVVIPAYNAVEYIASTLESVFAQDFKDFEVLLVNDGSPDTDALEREIAPYRSRIRYFKQENLGPSAARNLAIREAHGLYVAFLDADDFWLPHHLGNQVRHLSQNSRLGLVYANAFHLRGYTLVGTAFDRVPQAGTVDVENLLGQSCIINTSSVVVLRSALMIAGLFDETMRRCEDFDLWLRLAGMGVGMEYDRDVQVAHRIANGLAASSELMKKGRMRAYENFATSPAFRESHRRIVFAKLRTLDFEIRVELAKQGLLAGSYCEALRELQSARFMLSEHKLRFAEVALRYFPAGARWAYRAHLRKLEREKLRREVMARQNAGAPLELQNGRTFARPITAEC